MVFSSRLGVCHQASTGPVRNFVLERGVMLAQFGAPVQKLCKNTSERDLLEATDGCGFVGINIEYRIELGDLQQVADLFREMQKL